MKLFVIACVAGSLGLAAVFYASYLILLNGWASAPEALLLVVLGAAVGSLAAKGIVAAVLKLNHF